MGLAVAPQPAEKKMLIKWAAGRPTDFLIPFVFFMLRPQLVPHVARICMATELSAPNKMCAWALYFSWFSWFSVSFHAFSCTSSSIASNPLPQHLLYLSHQRYAYTKQSLLAFIYILQHIQHIFVAICFFFCFFLPAFSYFMLWLMALKHWMIAYNYSFNDNIFACWCARRKQ